MFMTDFGSDEVGRRMAEDLRLSRAEYIKDAVPGSGGSLELHLTGVTLDFGSPPRLAPDPASLNSQVFAMGERLGYTNPSQVRYVITVLPPEEPKPTPR